MQLSLWTYPWDVADQSVEPVIEEVRGLGLNTVSLATSYHAGRFVQPRGRSRKSYFPEDGTVYFRPSADLWTDAVIRPKMAEQVERDGDMLRALVDARAASGVRTSCWTVCLHNTRLGMLHPDHVARNAFGDPSFYSLCPSSPAARAYARTLAKDISQGYRPDMIELETPSFMGFTHGYHHEKDGVGLTPEEDFFLSICFCEHCRNRAAADRVDAKAARRWVEAAMVEALERERPERTFPAFPDQGIEAFRSIPALHDYLRWRETVVTSLVGEIRAEAHPDTKVVVISDASTWYAGLDLEEVARACDGLLLCLYGAPTSTVAGIADMRRAIGPKKFLGAGFRLFHPEMTGPEELAEVSETAIDAGATGVNYYNFGLVPAKRLQWIRQATLSL
ncbi:hypothetical protein [Arvimicrobium flavum]|uniref:hypothetical protein n=1 Tax=Arvimicrobium flavum TaxID=3393320 RepID=UPI00237A6607|nr:hypothetical protein [Mesorhizobium shangrilense]